MPCVPENVLFETPWTAAHQASLLLTNSQSLLKLMSIESVMPSNLHQGGRAVPDIAHMVSLILGLKEG